MKLFSAIARSFRQFFAKCRDVWYVPAKPEAPKPVEKTVKRPTRKTVVKHKNAPRK